MLPDTFAVHGETDGTRLVLMASGTHIERAAQRLQLMTPLIKDSDPPGAVVLPLTWAAVVQLSHTYGAAWRTGPRLQAWTRAELLRRTGSASTELVSSVKLPPDLTPYPWQAEGANLIAATGRALLTDDPGTGKTITAILGLLTRHEADAMADVRPVVVVCPASVVDPWVDAWRAWAPGFVTVAWRGTPKQRAALVGTADVYVTSYDTASRDAGPQNSKTPSPLLRLGVESVVVDECHLIKTPVAVRSLAVRRLARKAGNVIALSGTPITHHPGDLWPTLVALDPHAWPARERWIARYCETVRGDYGEQIIGLDPAHELEFRMTLAGQQRRVAKADCLALPPKVYSVRTVDLPPAWRKVYDDMAGQMLASLPDNDDAELSVMGVLAQLTRLSQLASAATDLAVTYTEDEHGETREHQHVTLKRPSWKVDALLEVLRERPGSPVVAFAPSRQLVRLAGEAAEEAGLSVGYVVGGQKPSERTENVQRFQAGHHDLLCVTTGAGGVGLTLTAARTVVFLQRPWSLVEALQAEDRCHRIGSEHHDSIDVIDIVARNTIDTRVRSVLRDKAGQLADLVQDRRIVTELLGGIQLRGKRDAA